MKFCHHRLLLFFLLPHALQFFGGLLHLALGHSALDISSGENAGQCRIRLRCEIRTSILSLSVSHQRASSNPGQPYAQQTVFCADPILADTGREDNAIEAAKPRREVALLVRSLQQCQELQRKLQDFGDPGQDWIRHCGKNPCE